MCQNATTITIILIVTIIIFIIIKTGFVHVNLGSSQSTPETIQKTLA